jgi:hypothetical protein
MSSSGGVVWWHAVKTFLQESFCSTRRGASLPSVSQMAAGRITGRTASGPEFKTFFEESFLQA